MMTLIVGALICLATLVWVLAPLFARGAVPLRIDDEEWIGEVAAPYSGSRAVCRQCGVRPEDDAVYCSTCGAALRAMAAPRS
jgi:hypothetical protein